MIKYSVRHFGVDTTMMWRNLNWNNRHRRLSKTEISNRTQSVGYLPTPKSRLMHRNIKIVRTQEK